MNHCEPLQEFICCGRIFSNIRRYGDHGKNHFINEISTHGDENVNNSNELNIPETNDIISNEIVTVKGNLITRTDLDRNKYKLLFMKQLLKNLSKSSITRQLCFEFGNETLNFFEEFLKLILSKSQVNLKDLDHELDDFVSNIASGTSKISEYKFFKYLDDFDCLIPYREIVIQKKLISIHPQSKYDKKSICVIDIKYLFP